MNKRQIKQLITAKEYDNHVPGKLLMTSAPLWDSLHLSTFSFPNLLPIGPAPGLPNYAIGFLYGGAVTGEVSINNGKWKPRTSINRGCMDLWPRFFEVNWRWWPNDNPEPIRIASVQLPNAFLSKVGMEALDTEPNLIEIPNKLNVKDPLMEQLLLSAIGELERGNPCGKLYGDTAAQMLALHLLIRHCTFTRRCTEYKRGLSKSQLLRVLDYINAHPGRNIRLDDLAALTGMSAYHFLRQFRKSMNQSPLQYIISARMEPARKLLLKSRLSVTEIALEIGYESISHFINLFKRHTGVTPDRYRRELGNE
jgi:AraC family transcriptional regulator